MTSKELIHRVAEYKQAPRIGFDFNNGNSDFGYLGCSMKYNPDVKYKEWGRYPELLEKVPNFTGEICKLNGNIIGRLNGKTKGECIYAALEEGWDNYNYDKYYEFYLKPRMNPDNYIIPNRYKSDKFILFCVFELQSVIRDARRLVNMLADTILETENLKRFIDACADIACVQTEIAANAGADSIMIYDDWGLQTSLYINPKTWRVLWMDSYSRVAHKAHSLGLKCCLHSCGYIFDIVPDLIKCGVDIFQFDQPSIYNYEKLAGLFNGKSTLYSPVDIQRYLPTGDRSVIEEEAKRMIKYFWQNGGGLIAKDYPSYNDINVKDEWAQYARKIFVEYN